MSTLLHNEHVRKRDLKASEKQQSIGLEQKFETGPAGVFNFNSGCFRPKDNSEGTLKSISRLRKQSLDVPESH